MVLSNAVTTAQPQLPPSGYGIWTSSAARPPLTARPRAQRRDQRPSHARGSGELNTAYSFVPKSAIIVPDAPDLARDGQCHDLLLAERDHSAPALNGVDYDMFMKGDHSSKAARSRSKSRRTGRRRACSGCARRQAAAGGTERGRRALAPGDLPAHRQSDHRDGRRRNLLDDEGDRLDHGHRSGPTRLARERGRLVQRCPRRGHLFDRQRQYQPGPVVDAGPDQTITLPSSANLNGTVTDDGLPNPPGRSPQRGAR